MRRSFRASLILLVVLTCVGRDSAMAQVGTAFTYQGRLLDGAAPANGSYDLELKLWDAASAGGQVGSTSVLPGVAVSSGLFTVAVDFGAGTFSGARRWIEIGVRPAGGGAFTTLAPRQELTPVAHAVFAANAASATTLAGLSCASGQVAKWAGSAWTCGTDVDTNSGGTVTKVAAGTGLTGGSITTAGTVSVAAGGITSALLADAAVTSSKIAAGAVGAAQIDATQVQARLAAVCPLGQFLQGVNANGSVFCASPSATLTTVDGPPNEVGEYTSIAIGQDGLPVISYYDQTAFALRVAKCVNAACTGTSTITLVDTTFGNVGLYTSIAIGQDGLPVISYWAMHTLKVAKCVDAACAGSSILTVVDDPANNVGEHTSIAIGQDGFPVISYRDTTAGALKVAKCVNPACTGVSVITTVDDLNDVGKYTSIAIGADGFPVISYYDQSAGGLKVAKCVNPACTGTSTITFVDNPAHDVGWYTSIAIGQDGIPVISYKDLTFFRLKVAKCANAACTGASTLTIVDTPPNNLGFHTSIAIGQDVFPVISYRDATAGALKVAKCVNPACTGVSVITTVDKPENSVGDYTSIALGSDGLPVISYYDRTARALKVAKCVRPSCAP